MAKLENDNIKFRPVKEAPKRQTSQIQNGDDVKELEAKADEEAAKHHTTAMSMEAFPHTPTSKFGTGRSASPLDR
jgi:hypothetical protein